MWEQEHGRIGILGLFSGRKRGQILISDPAHLHPDSRAPFVPPCRSFCAGILENSGT